jgi:hypothetical protein
MKLQKIFYLIYLLGFSIWSSAQIKNNWTIIQDGQAIEWTPEKATVMPYNDNIEMSGKDVSAIIYYKIDQKQDVTIERDVIFPQLRTYLKKNEDDWRKYRAYFRRKVKDSLGIELTVNGQAFLPTKVAAVRFDGMLHIEYKPVHGCVLTKHFFPSMEGHLFVEEWEIKNLYNEDADINMNEIRRVENEAGYKGMYSFHIFNTGGRQLVSKGNTCTYSISFAAGLNQSYEDLKDKYKNAKYSRQAFLREISQKLILKTPDQELNTMFRFAKYRAAESIFNSAMGLVHSPGGGNYYVGVWANDQVEYSGPFFPHLGYDTGNVAAFNAYKQFLTHIPEGDSMHIGSSWEIEGVFHLTFADRGDAAMIAYGASLYALNKGDREIAKKLWPLIEWSLDYCHRKKNAQGAISSESDEMEGRIETGSANLSTSSLYYAGLKYAAIIAQDLGKTELAAVYRTYRQTMEGVIENYFGATIEGLQTYRYYDGNTHLRHWICLPMTMGIHTRSKGTATALFDKLWTDNGVLVEYNPENPNVKQMFWDRATLYALRGALKGGLPAGVEKLQQYTSKRLLGDHVPYAVEAYPENNMKHLSAESALYCRIFTEGLLGIEPVSFDEVKITPYLPPGWNQYTMEHIFLSSAAVKIDIKRKKQKLHVQVSDVTGAIILDKVIKNQESVVVKI